MFPNVIFNFNTNATSSFFQINPSLPSLQLKVRKRLSLSEPIINSKDFKHMELKKKNFTDYSKETSKQKANIK